MKLPAIVPLGFGIIIGLLVVNGIGGNDAPPPNVVAAPVEPQAAHTVVVEVNAVLSIPTPTLTPIPTAYPTAAATVDVSLNWCSNKTPRAGQECQMAPAPTPTEAQRPECPAAPSVWCVWPDQDETEGGQDVD